MERLDKTIERILCSDRYGHGRQVQLTKQVGESWSPPSCRDGALLRGSKTDPQRPLPTDPLT